MLRTDPKLKVGYIPITDIIPYENNPRIHKSKQIRQIVNSIEKFDFNNPILIDRLLQHGDVYYLKGESYRLKDKDKSLKQEASDNKKAESKKTGGEKI